MQVQHGDFTPHVSNRQHGKRMSKGLHVTFTDDQRKT